MPLQMVSLIPSLVHVRGTERLSVLVRLVGEEAISGGSCGAWPMAIRACEPAAARSAHRSWRVAQLARTAALSRSAFFERFTRTVGLPPMEYLLARRMAIAKDLLRRQDLDMGEVVERVGYGSAGTFSTAFNR